MTAMIGQSPIALSPIAALAGSEEPMTTLSVSAVLSVSLSPKFVYRRSILVAGAAAGSITPTYVHTRTLSVSAVVDASIGQRVTRSASLSVSAVANAAVATTLTARRTLWASAMADLSIKPFGDASETWVFNADTGGFTRYEGFAFNSFAKINGRYYGCKADGIYALDGNTDNGDPIQAMVSFGKQDFGTSALKRITNAYVGTSGEGKLYLRVLAEGQGYTYAARSYDEHLQVQRFDTGKGLRVNWLEFELYNASGEDFELASMEFAIVPTTRRI